MPEQLIVDGIDSASTEHREYPDDFRYAIYEGIRAGEGD